MSNKASLSLKNVVQGAIGYVTVVHDFGACQYTLERLINTKSKRLNRETINVVLRLPNSASLDQVNLIFDEIQKALVAPLASPKAIKRSRVAEDFVILNGNVYMRNNTREHAHTARKFWHVRIHPKDGLKLMSDSIG